MASGTRLRPIEQPNIKGALVSPSSDAADSLISRIQSSPFMLRPMEAKDDPLWLRILAEIHDMAREEPALRRYYRNTILQYDTLDCALIHHLSNKLANDSVSAGEWFKMLEAVLREPCGRQLSELMRTDLLAIMARDPACEGPAHALLNYKGYLGLQASRIAHQLWLQKRRSLALAIQSRVSEIFGMDVHPAAKIGRGVMIDHATGVVIGETAVIGNDCTILHGVTLGGTGKDRGDRHPKLGNGILIGAGALILGNIRIGDSCKVAAGSVVLASLPPHTTAAGVPAKVIGRALESKPGMELDHSLENVSYNSDHSATHDTANHTTATAAAGVSKQTGVSPQKHRGDSNNAAGTQTQSTGSNPLAADSARQQSQSSSSSSSGLHTTPLQRLDTGALRSSL